MREERHKIQANENYPSRVKETYSLETIIRLQKLLAGGIPEEIAECAQPRNSPDDEITSLQQSQLSPQGNNRDLSNHTQAGLTRATGFLNTTVRRLCSLIQGLGGEPTQGRPAGRGV
ncbi:MAG: hypothetical protein ACE14M_12030 [Terriglobales bacterium]